MEGQRRQGLPAWMPAFIAGIVSFGVGLILGASFTSSERARQGSTVESLTSKVSALERHAADREKLIQEHDASLTALRTDIASKDKTIASLRSDIDRLKRKLDTASQALANARTSSQQRASTVSERGPPATGTQVSTPKQTDDEEDIIVYVTRTGRKYHRGSCSYLRKSAIPMTLKAAKAAGYSPCSRCRPPI